MSERQRMTTRLKTLFQQPALFVLYQVRLRETHRGSPTRGRSD